VQLIIENLPPTLAARLAEGTAGDRPVSLPNAPIGSAFKRRIAALGITKPDCAALESSLDAIRGSRSDSLQDAAATA
jgi:hypothetical protein